LADLLADLKEVPLLPANLGLREAGFSERDGSSALERESSAFKFINERIRKLYIDGEVTPRILDRSGA
jgi:hypothetical protein